VVQVISAGRGYFASLVRWGFVDVIVRITLKEISHSPVPLNLSQESPALLCLHRTGKPIGKMNLPAKAIVSRMGISCTDFSHNLVLLRSLSQVFRDYGIFSLKAYGLT